MPIPVELQHRYLKFGTTVLHIAQLLPKTTYGKHVADQLFRSGTSAGANYFESRAAESRADFLHKMQVALKEAREAGYWLGIVDEGKMIDFPALKELRQECYELTAILAKSVITTKANDRKIYGTSKQTSAAGDVKG